MSVSPVKQWTRLLGSSSVEWAKGISTTANGSIYITGITTGSGSLDGHTNSGGADAFISKYSSDGTKAWTRLLGSSSDDSGNSISTAADGSIYITGYTTGSLDGQTNSGGTDAFISKYSSDGTRAWTRLLGSSSFQQGYSISTAADGSIYIAGYTTGSLDGQTNSGGTDAFISKYSSDGTRAWTRLLGSSSGETAHSISTAADGSIYITGSTTGSLDGQTNSGGTDAFISKYSSDGTRAWTRLLGSSSDETAHSISTAADGSIYITGSTTGSLDGQIRSVKETFGLRGIPFKPNPFTDAFISKYSSDGTRAWTRLLGSSSDDSGNSISTAADGSIYITGSTTGSLDGQTNSGKRDAFISKYSSDGTRAWTRLLGSSSDDSGFSISTAADGSIYITGGTDGSLDGHTNSGSGDAFISKFGAARITPTYFLSTYPSFINEGSTLTTSVATTNVTSGTKLYYSLSGSGINGSDFSSGSLSADGVIGSDGKFSFNHVLVNDLTIEGDETLFIKIYTDSARTKEVASTSVLIKDNDPAVVLNHPATGTPSIDGKVVGDALISANTSPIRDADGLGRFSYRWSLQNAKGSWIELATTKELKLTNDMVRAPLKLNVSFTDGKGNLESLTSSEVTFSCVDPDILKTMTPSDWEAYADRYRDLQQSVLDPTTGERREINPALNRIILREHYLNYGCHEGRVLKVTTGKEDLNDYGAYVENYGTTLLDVYRSGTAATNPYGDKRSLFEWGKWHYDNFGKAEGRQIAGGVDWGAIVRNDSTLLSQFTDAQRIRPSLTAFQWGYDNQSSIKGALGIAIGTDLADTLSAQRTFALGGDDTIIGTTANDILHGGFGNDAITGGGGKDLVYGGPGDDIFQLAPGSILNIRDFRKGADLIQLTGGLRKAGVSLEEDFGSGVSSTVFVDTNSAKTLGSVYGMRPGDLTFAIASKGVGNVWV